MLLFALLFIALLCFAIAFFEEKEKNKHCKALERTSANQKRIIDMQQREITYYKNLSAAYQSILKKE